MTVFARWQFMSICAALHFKNVLARYQALGLTPVVALRLSFYLTEANTDPSAVSGAHFKSGRAENGQSAFSMNMLNELAPFWDEFNAAIDAIGIKGDTWIHEMGLSQYEINLVHGDPLALADQAFMFKYAAKEIAIKHGLNAICGETHSRPTRQFYAFTSKCRG